ncbi:monocarboxylate transporter 12-like [Hydractinia symbiolongicarpus]|uniref:monocarboxylate transporter 12-like n=1 Tax=Hydractinia symbiolongicarpus TaxID=13093 RepID=UPI00254DD88A|nr:monocarboxylate transporter 12-like [Hydractinia symbiolongicarpus]
MAVIKTTLLASIDFLESSSTSTDRNWSWVVLFSSSMIAGFTWGIQHVSGIFYSVWLEEFKISKGTVAWITGLPLGLLLLLSPLYPIIYRKLKGFQIGSVFGSILTGISLLLSSYVTNVYLLFFTYSFLTGIGLLLLATPAVMIIPKYFHKHVSFATAFATTGSFITPLFLSPLISYLNRKFCWRVAFRVLGILVILICTPCGLLWRNHSSDTPNLHSLQGKKSTKAWNKYKHLLKNRHYLIFLLATTLGSLDASVSLTHLVQHAIESGTDRNDANWLPVYLSLGNVIGRLCLGKIFDIQCINKMIFYKILMIMSGLTAVVGSFSVEFYQLILFAICYTIFDGAHKAQQSIILLNIAGKKLLLEGWTLLMSLGAITFVLGPVLVGYFSSGISSYKVMFYFMSVPSILASLLLNLMYIFPEVNMGDLSKETKSSENNAGLLEVT